LSAKPALYDVRHRALVTGYWKQVAVTLHRHLHQDVAGKIIASLSRIHFVQSRMTPRNGARRSREI
jgi:hypothetical protein